MAGSKRCYEIDAAGNRDRHDNGYYFIEGGLRRPEQISERSEGARHADI